GQGMDSATRERIYEPFFTTKEAGKGTGLGLSTVYGIVKQSGGSIWVYSEPGRGATFKVYLPVAAASPAAGDQRPDRAREQPTGTETILVVEDHDQIRTLLHTMLEQLGYTTLMASNAGEALAISDAHPDRIHAVLTDAVMPGMSGPKLAHAVK